MRKRQPVMTTRQAYVLRARNRQLESALREYRAAVLSAADDMRAGLRGVNDALARTSRT